MREANYFEEVCDLVEEGFTIEEAVDKFPLLRGRFYYLITPQQKWLLRSLKNCNTNSIPNETYLRIGGNALRALDAHRAFISSEFADDNVFCSRGGASLVDIETKMEEKTNFYKLYVNKIRKKREVRRKENIKFAEENKLKEERLYQLAEMGVRYNMSKDIYTYGNSYIDGEELRSGVLTYAELEWRQVTAAPKPTPPKPKLPPKIVPSKVNGIKPGKLKVGDRVKFTWGVLGHKERKGVIVSKTYGGCMVLVNGRKMQVNVKNKFLIKS